MAAQALLDALIADLGSARPERDDPRLQPGSARLDDRDTPQLLAALRALAPLIRHYDADAPTAAPGDWRGFFPGDAAELAALVARRDGSVPPHQALLIAFLRLLERPQARLNEFTARHLQVQMRDVLGFVPRPPRPDRVHLLVEPKKGAAAFELDGAHRFSAGKDAFKVEQLYAPVRSTVVSAGRVARLASLVRDGEQLRFAPIADSADGLGAPLPPAAPHWPPFARPGLPPAPVGFAIASPLLRLAEGERRIELRLRLAGLAEGLSATDFAASFDAHLTGPKGWLGPFALDGTRSGDVLTLVLELGAAHAAVVDHDPALHQHAFPAALPVVQCLLKPRAALGYAALEGLTLRRVRVAVRVAGMRSLVLENDEATLDPKKAFLPFGATPVAGAQLHIGCAEALAKPVSALSVRLAWQGAPPDLYDWYAGYSRRSQMNNGIGAKLSWRDASGAAHASSTVTLLARVAGPTTLDVVAGSSSTPVYAPANQALALQWSGSAAALQVAGASMLMSPVWATAPLLAVQLAGTFATPPAAATPRAGFVSVTLVEDLLHADFATDAARGATPPSLPLAKGATFTPTILRPPYTPKVQEITLDYAAASDDSRIDDPAQAAFTDTAVQFFQIDALGLAREHAWLGAQRPWAPQGGVALLPAHPAAGELYVALDGARAGDAISVLFQVAEGSADPLAPAQTLQWSVLADNAWRTLAPGELVLDTTRGLRASGLIGAVLPRETSTAHTRLPAGPVWLRAATPAAPGAACAIVGVFANAVEAVFVDQGNDPAHYALPLAPGRITKLKAPPAAVKGVRQPYASFGQAPHEDDAALARRASERLRHRNRAVTGWDVERLVLEAFPSVYRVKCIPHARPGAWLAAGHLTVVVVPDLRHDTLRQALQPRVDLDTLTRIRAHLVARCAPQVQVHVVNPGYRAVQLDFKVRLRPGFGFNFHGPRIDLALQQALSPWAFDSAAGLGFGARVVRSQLLDFVESLPAVDFVTDFRLGLEGRGEDHDEIVPDAPDAILVSAAAHHIEELSDG
jgi:hypothetical protein